MYKSVFYGVAFLLLPLAVQAQHIPDANFAQAIADNCPSCIDGNNDLTIDAQSLTDLYVSGYGITDLTGIDGFTSLVNLSCALNDLTGLPSLPTGLTTLYCQNNQLTSLPTLPTGLTFLNCINNQLTALPTLPTGLTGLGCGNNQLTNLPTLPIGLTGLNCGENQLTNLPTLPTGLTTLYCQSNQLTSLPTLPTGLTGLYCHNNQLTALPTLPTGLTDLRCTGNQLTSLPALPNSLIKLSCSYNPTLNCLPILPASLSSAAGDFEITNTAISCLPNRPANFASYPLPDCPAAITESTCSAAPYIWPANGQAYTSSGTYNHVNGCGQTETLILTTLSATVSKTNNLCHNDCAGTATVNATSGTAPYSYAWSNGQVTQTATGMCYGAYNVTVSDANGCSIKKSSIFILQSSAISATPTISNKTCSVLGSVSVAVSGGTGTKTFLWSNGANTSSITGLSNGGTYYLTVTDANGCQEVFSYFVDDICFSIAISKNDITTCTQTCTGDATVTTTNGMAPYTYLWSNGQTAATATGLCKQNYTVSVTDANNVLRTASISITHSSLAVTYIATPTTCNGICDGTATVSPSGAQAPYTFAWNNNAGNQTTQTATGLCYGTYNVTITSANGCSMVKKYITVGQPSAIALTTSSTAASCANDGTATVSVNNGVAPFVYAWSNAGNTASITGLASGTYTVTVTDANGCMKTKNVTVANACGAKPTENGNLLAEESILDEPMPTNENTDINETLRLNDFALVDAFNVYPNPNQGQFTIDIQLAAEANALLRIHDVLGRTLLEQNLEGQSFQVAIDAKTWTNGNYFVQLISNKGQTTRKVLVSNE